MSHLASDRSEVEKPPVEMADMADEIVRLNRPGPPAKPEGACWESDVTPAVIETVTEQVVVTPEVRGADGLVMAPAAYRTDTQTRIEEPNVVGNRVVLRPGGQIGRDDGKVVIPLLSADRTRLGLAAELTADERLAIMSAESDDMSLDKTTWTLTVVKKDTFNVLSSKLNVNSSGFVYLGADTTDAYDTLKTKPATSPRSRRSPRRSRCRAPGSATRRSRSAPSCSPAPPASARPRSPSSWPTSWAST